METYLGLDFGGTKLLIGEMQADGQILRSKRYDTRAASCEEAVTLLLSALRDYRQTVGFGGELRGAGIGIVGVVDHHGGRWISMNHEVTGPAIPLARLVAEEAGVPVAIDNDVRSATTAELLLGHGQSSRHFIYLNVGTGVAAGFVIDGRVLRGAHNNSGEVGHVCCDMSDHSPCVCGRAGCVENVVSGMGFTTQFKQLHALYPQTALIPGADGRVDALQLFHLADAGDPLAKRIAEHGAQTLSELIMNLVRVSDPNLVVLGGGVVSDGWMLERVKMHLNPSTMRGVTGGVVLSAFPPKETGLIGAAALGMQKVKCGGGEVCTASNV